MYKIKYIPTGNIFTLPDSEAKELKEKFPDDYQILEKGGKKVKDKIQKKPLQKDDKSILELVLDTDEEKPLKRGRKKK